MNHEQAVTCLPPLFPRGGSSGVQVELQRRSADRASKQGSQVSNPTSLHAEVGNPNWYRLIVR